MTQKKVLVAVSGGVDSSVAAYLLKESGHDVVAVTMCLGVAAESDPGGAVKCCGPQEIEDARRVCGILGINHYILDFAADLEEQVIQPFIAEYIRGRTPNPCVECNRAIKFGSLLRKAHSMGFDYIATGHYSRLDCVGNECHLMVPKDRKKDQTYFLHSIPREVLTHVVFPLADLTKDEVRDLARKAKLPVSEKFDSQDICFIPKEGYGSFLSSRLGGASAGDIVDRKGNVLGEHKGVAYYTIGQRSGLGISHKVPLYVLEVDAGGNRITVGEKKDLQARELIAENVNMLVDEWPVSGQAKIRYAHRAAKCSISTGEDGLHVLFEKSQESITPGQSVVLYDGDLVLGGGVIKEVIHEHQ
jgi:tRNA-uridine 2-sulfurtransferase